MVTSRRRRFFASVSIEHGTVIISPLVGFSVSNASESFKISSLQSVSKESRWKLSMSRLLPFDLVSIKTLEGKTIRIDGPGVYKLANELTLDLAALGR